MYIYICRYRQIGGATGIPEGAYVTYLGMMAYLSSPALTRLPSRSAILRSARA